jgi:hypothetical protein
MESRAHGYRTFERSRKRNTICGKAVAVKMTGPLQCFEKFRIFKQALWNCMMSGKLNKRVANLKYWQSVYVAKVSHL